MPALRALADPVRLRLLAMMTGKPATAGDLGTAFAVSQPTISHHLKALFEAGLVVRSRAGTTVSYRLNPRALDGVNTLLRDLVEGAAAQPAPAPSPRGRARPELGLGTAEQVLHRGAEDLAYRFAGVFAVETIERAVRESYQSLYRTAAVKTHVPVLALRFAEDRLTALAQAEGRMPKPLTEVLLLCTHNAGRSQLAAGYLRTLGQGSVHVRSAGSLPGAQVNPVVAHVMTERGIDVGSEFPKPLTDDVLGAADVVVTMGCGDACPLYPGKRYLDWDLQDPEGLPLEQVRSIADAVELKVRQLLVDIGAREMGNQ